ncbi:hypothetical protein SAE02_42840 [Skermanella aerolata]|uniref:Uncharacterized protein n=1 Tax=Skermanella aerolata TaxID=393310 RepID=A0A512DUI5_9PROT|nr:hypothetical protein SAE02_42840 [Skermanella aerolata]
MSVTPVSDGPSARSSWSLDGGTYLGVHYDHRYSYDNDALPLVYAILANNDVNPTESSRKHRKIEAIDMVVEFLRAYWQANPVDQGL